MLTILTMLVAAQAAPPAPVQVPKKAASTQFAKPQLLMAGDRPMGKGILYPSPEFRDMNGDGHADIVIGDLWGNLQIATSQPQGDSVGYTKLMKLKTSDGEELKFDNW